MNSGFLLDTIHVEFIERFRGLGKEDQCLFVRLANRKGRVFRLKHIKYEEIPNLGESITRLKETGMLRDPQEGDHAEFLGCISRKELVDLIKALPNDGVEGKPKLGSAAKSELISFLQKFSDFWSLASLEDASQAIVIDRGQALDYLLFLYFGRLKDGLGDFALRDLGILKTRQGIREFQARFKVREVALAAYFYQKLSNEIYHADPAKLLSLAAGIQDWPVVDDYEISSKRHRSIYRLGRALERNGLGCRALAVYLLTDQFPATERAVRLLHQAGKSKAVAAKLRQMIEDPSCDEELIFAEDFYERKFGKRKVGRLTELLRHAKVLVLDESGREYPESAAVSFLEREGLQVRHVENAIWSQLFGVVFWEALFENPLSIHSDFDRFPKSLGAGTFYSENDGFVESQLIQLRIPGWISARVELVLARMEEIPNSLVFSEVELFEWVVRMAECSPPGASETVLREMAKDFRGNRSGFPDLVICDDGRIRFIEIKTEGDQIQRHQLAQIERLRRAGYDVEVARIQWSLDPQQIYVVVDVETTGGNPESNRVIEIGAVKVQDGEVIDQWSSLINPGGKIPRMIVQLTGITDELLAVAPRFSEIAEEFRAFLGGAVFVGHRVTFDFGFIKEEYRRINQDLRAPTFCTVVETRRHFPGFTSYGLANLCQEFGIELTSHHRALCDARATAEILFKINQKRRESLTNSEGNYSE